MGRVATRPSGARAQQCSTTKSHHHRRRATTPARNMTTRFVRIPLQQRHRQRHRDHSHSIYFIDNDVKNFENKFSCNFTANNFFFFDFKCLLALLLSRPSHHFEFRFKAQSVCAVGQGSLLKLVAPSESVSCTVSARL